MTVLPKILPAILAMALALGAASQAGAQQLQVSATAPAAPTPKYYSWMSPDVVTAWSSKYLGQGSR